MAINPETQYPGKIAPSTPEYPYGAARNITLPGDGTGTPWEAAIVNDNLGFQQALLTAASIVPSGTPEKATGSQYLQALQFLSGVNRATLDDLVADKTLLAGMRSFVAERTAGNGGGGFWSVVLASTVTINGLNVVACTGVPTLALVLAPYNRVVSGRQFGLTGVGTGEAARIQAFLDYLSTSRDVGYIDGQFWYESDVEVPSNVTLYGNGKTFTSSIIPLAGAVLRLGTASVLSQHIEISDITITCDQTGSADTIIKFENCYSVRLRRLRLFNIKDTQRGIDFEGGGDCGLHEVTARPVSGGGGTNVVYVNSANTVDGVDHSLTIENCDLEGGQDTIKVVSGHADISGIYSERSSRSILSVAGGSATLRGGQLINSGGSALPVIVEGGALTVYGSSYYDGEGGEPFVYYLNSGDFSKSSFYGVPNNQIFINVGGDGLPSVFANGQDNSTFAELFTTVDMVDEQVINVCTFSTNSLEAKTIVMGYELEAVVTSRGFGKSHRVLRGMLSKLSTGEYQFSTPTDVVNTSEDTSLGNSTVQLVPTVVDGSTGAINLELLLTGTLNQGNTEQVWLRFKLLGRTDGVNVDFYGNRNQPT